MFRLIDSGVRDGRLQIAYDAALTDLHAAGDVPDTVRFMRFPPTVLIGRHQVLAQEVHLDRCAAEGVELVRRVTGGGAIYLDEGQVGWELVLGRKTLALAALADYAAAISGAVAAGLEQAFGIAARFRPRNDIEVAGRKIGGTGGYFSGDTLVFQGTVLVDMNAQRMAHLLNTPAHKLARHSANAESRVVTLKELLGDVPSVGAVHDAILTGLQSHLGIVTFPAEPSAEEHALTAAHFDADIGQDSFVHHGDWGVPRDRDAPCEPILDATRATPGGTVTAYVRLEGTGQRRSIREISLTGDFFVAPPRALYDLEARLRGAHIDEAGSMIDTYFSEARIAMLSLTPSDFRAVVDDALAKDSIAKDAQR